MAKTWQAHATLGNIVPIQGAAPISGRTAQNSSLSTDRKKSVVVPECADHKSHPLSLFCHQCLVSRCRPSCPLSACVDVFAVRRSAAPCARRSQGWSPCSEQALAIPSVWQQVATVEKAELTERAATEGDLQKIAPSSANLLTGIISPSDPVSGTGTRSRLRPPRPDSGRLRWDRSSLTCSS
jgi:hypothetical protein